MLSSSLYAMTKLSKTSSPQKLFNYDCVSFFTQINSNYLFFYVNPCHKILRYPVNLFVLCSKSKITLIFLLDDGEPEKGF